jgi:nucleoside-diphosphate-sugar epimerase
VSTIFVTGGSGNLGRCVLRELARRGHEVVALVRQLQTDLEGVRQVEGSLATVLNAEVAAADGVIHAASSRSTDRGVVLAEDIAGTGWLLDAWQKGPFVFTSSQTLYGIPTGVLHEDTSPAADNWYDLGKLCNELQLSMAARERAQAVGVSLRVPLLFASGPRRRDRQLLPLLLDPLLRGDAFFFRSEEALETYGSVYVGEEDAGQAIADALSITESGAFNFCSGFCTWRELIETLARHVGRKARFAVHPEPVRTGEFRVWQSRSFYNTEKFRRATSFVPRQSLDELVARFIASEACAGA